MPPPELSRDAPILDVVHPVQIDVAPAFREESHAAVLDDIHRGRCEIRIRWEPLPGNLRLEAGYAHLFAGEFMEDAPNSPDNGDADYVYTQVQIGF